MKRITTGSPFETALGYSRAVVKGGWCLVSGVTGYNHTKMEMPRSAADQAETCFSTIDDVLNTAGFALSDFVRVQYALVSADLVGQVALVLDALFAETPPAATMVITGPTRPEVLIEIEVTAFKG